MDGAAAALATPVLVATRAVMETALAAEEMKKSRRSMEVSSLHSAAFNEDDVRAEGEVEVGNENDDAVAARRASDDTNFILVLIDDGCLAFELSPIQCAYDNEHLCRWLACSCLLHFVLLTDSQGSRARTARSNIKLIGSSSDTSCTIISGAFVLPSSRAFLSACSVERGPKTGLFCLHQRKTLQNQSSLRRPLFHSLSLLIKGRINIIKYGALVPMRSCGPL